MQLIKLNCIQSERNARNHKKRPNKCSTYGKLQSCIFFFNAILGNFTAQKACNWKQVIYMRIICTTESMQGSFTHEKKRKKKAELVCSHVNKSEWKSCTVSVEAIRLVRVFRSISTNSRCVSFVVDKFSFRHCDAFCPMQMR